MMVIMMMQNHDNDNYNDHTVAVYTRGRGERSRDSHLAKKRIYVEVTRVLSKSRDRLTKGHYQLLKKSRKSPEYSQNRATVLQKETLT